MNKLIETLARLLFFLAVVAAVWGYGVLSATKNLFPYNEVRSAYSAAKSTFDVLFVPHHLFPAVYGFSGVKVHDREKISNGSTLITSYFSDLDWQPGIKLLDVDGNVLHSWNANPAVLFPEKNGVRFNYVHGTHLFPNGDVLLNIEYAGLVRMGACGDIIWRLDYPATHHSISRSHDGNFWISANITRRDDEEGQRHLAKYVSLHPPVYEDHIIKVSPGGKILRDINVIDVIYDNDLYRLIAKIGKQFSGDIFHLNDVEELSEDMAKEYPLFEAGDLVVSLKFLDLVMVLDPDTLTVKWHTADSTIGQHDPDFIGDGWIGIFDNNLDETARGTFLGGSRILAIQPHTGIEKVLYPTDLSDPFYTALGGKWQLLPNGNMLMVEARTGRALEVSSDGRTVWEWVNEKYDEKLIPEVLEAARYDIRPDDISSWQCAQ